MSTTVRVFHDTYVDSVVQLGAVRAMREVEGVEWASAGMATPANVDALREEGVAGDELADSGSDDFFVAVRAADDEAILNALSAAEEAAFPGAPAAEERPVEVPARSVREAAARRPGSNLAVISVPGQYAALPAYQALTRGMHVLLFSDNVPVEKEIGLKDYARGRGLLMMGPGAGTAVVSGVGLGFANVVRRGEVGIVAAAGTGAQESMCLLDRWGAGVSHVLGVGGRDLSSEVGGSAALSAVRALREDAATEVILLVSKPPAAEVAARVLASAAGSPLVATLIGGGGGNGAAGPVEVADTLEGGALAVLRALGLPAPDTAMTAGPSLEDARGRLGPSRRLVRGLFSGGSLCYESLVLLGRALGAVYSNTPLDPAFALPAPPHSHLCLDLGEEEFTQGRPHPMIDAEARVELLREHAADPDVAVIILDVVLGFGAHPDPAAVLAPECAAIMAADGPQVVVYVLGTDADPQDRRAQRESFLKAGCIVTETSARASLVAAAIATGRPSLAVEAL
ncbi:MAG TPA: FdrA family protein [Nocardioidaceae bacterium]|nr:FdrA family protein [Nocardioidaceae bacterium]